ncbi:MAG: YitT family protein [Burkholderiaceae bacterium]|nr:YitT family protein [Burkholderiaceae bacterium]MDH5209494.1 YitT family protein [Burkholderiaceae bacterium]
MFHPAQLPTRHTNFEDAQALVTGTLFVALGIAMYARVGLLTGGTAGLAFLVHYATGWRFGAVFFVINLPFAGFALRAMGTRFTVKTFVAVALLSAFTELAPRVVRFDWLQPAYAAVMGGFLIGAGLLILFRHQASLGGLNVLVLWLQQRYGWRAGKVQMALDCLIVVAALAIVEPAMVALSVLGAVAMNLVVAVNHKPGRYLGV